MSSNKHQLMTRRRSLALLSSSSAGLLIAGKGGFGTAFAKASDGDDPRGTTPGGPRTSTRGST